jgi:hypothetical protein
MERETMTYQLTIEMVGLCLFVPAQTDETLYVVMPTAGVEHGVDPHVARLVFDAAYGQPGSIGLEGYPVLVPLEGDELVLDTGEALDLALPHELVNVGTVARQPLLPGTLQGTPPPGLITSRALLRSGKLANYETGACWNYPNATIRQHMSNRITWDLGAVDGDQLDLLLSPLAGGNPSALAPLYPVDGRIELALYYTPREELPPDPVDVPPPPPGTPAHHFAAFYDIFEQPVAADPIPTFVGLSCSPFAAGGSPYTCMGAQTDPLP